MFRKMPFILAAVILAILMLDPVMPLDLKQVLYAISLSIKSLIVFLLPIIIFGLLFRAALTLAHHATRVIVVILIAVCCSNFLSTFLSHYVGIWIYQFDLSILLPHESSGLKAAWDWELPKLIPNQAAMFSGLVLGIMAGFVKSDMTARVAEALERVISKILASFLYLIPIFVAGFIVKLQFDGVIMMIIKDYTLILAIIALAQFSYILLAYFLLSNGRICEFLQSLKNMLPAAVSGFSTMSSAASMPLTIIGAENNAKDKSLAGSVIPATVNIHLIGDCFAIPIFAYAVLKNYGMPEPTLISYLIFTFYFVLAKFSVAAIPGGGIIVMLPILEAYLGFNADMMSLITALYILFDPVITCANVLGNGAFAKLMDRILSFRNGRTGKPSC
jgi:Na+/H+-dicarboxylate symporter